MLTDELAAMERGEKGSAVQWAIRQQLGVARFFGAPRLVPVNSVLAGAEIGITGESGLELIESLAAQGGRVAVPSFTGVCSLDFDRWSEFHLPQAQHDAEQRMHVALRSMGFIDVSSCVHYQSVNPPRFREHLAWGDTGAVTFANSVAGARSNYEGGPASIAAALTGHVPEYGFHVDSNRLASHLYEVSAPLSGTADWSALGAWIGNDLKSYWKVPALIVNHATPSVDELKQFLASAASFGSLALAHLIGITPEATDLAAAFGDRPVPAAKKIERADVDSIYERFFADDGKVDLVVFSAPQLSLQECTDIIDRLDGRRVADGTRLIITVNYLVKGELDRLGYTDRLYAAGGEIISGTCFYVMAPRLVRKEFGFRTLVTPSCKLANILGGAGYSPILRSVEQCIESAVSGRLVSGT